MIREPKKIEIIDTQALIEKIQSGYTVKRVDKFQTKKTFAPSTIAYSHGECPRYWYLAFEGAVFEDNADAYGAANMTAGTKSHERIQQAMMDSGIAEIYESDEGTFYRQNGDWIELSDEDDHFDFDGLMVIYVDPAFIAVYDEAEGSSEAIGINELKEYESAK